MDKASRKDALSRKASTEPPPDEAGPDLTMQGPAGTAAPVEGGSGMAEGSPDDAMAELAMAAQNMPPEKQKMVAQALEILSQVFAQPEAGPEEGTPAEEGMDMSNQKGGVPVAPPGA